MTKALLILAAASIPAMAGATASAAAPQSDVMIHYEDLNLATPAGEQVLRDRVSAAARATCGGPAQTGTRITPATGDCMRSFREAVGGQIEAAIAKAKSANGTAAVAAASGGPARN